MPAAVPRYSSGTTDIEGDTIDGVSVVVDIKTGLDVGHPADNWQGRFYSLCRARVRGASRAEFRVVYVAPSGKHRVESATFDAFDIDSAAIEVTDVYRRAVRVRKAVIETGDFSVSSGDWCRYCPAMTACPAKTALARSALPELTEIRDRLLAMPKDEQAAAYLRAKEIEAVLDVVLEGLKDLAKQEPIPLPGGKELRRLTVVQERLVQARAIDALRERGATDDDIAALYQQTETEQVRVMNQPGVTKAARGRKTKAA